MKKAALRVLSVFVTAALSLGLLTACSDESFFEDSEGYYEETEAVSGGISSQNQEPVADGEPGTWLVMLYQDADDDTLERDIFLDLNEAEVVGSTDQVTIVSQMDRYQDGFDGDGDWTTTKRFLIQQGYDLETIESEELEDLGEVNMSDPQTLVDFATWAIRSYPAEHYVLIMSDHGMGWLGGWSDPDPYEDDMSMAEMDDALAVIVNDTGIGQFEFIGFDACLMAQLESLSILSPYARYAAASEETEPAVGWAYAAFLQTLVDNPGMTGAELAVSVVGSYINEDFRITDDDARVSFVEETYDYGGDMSAEEVAYDMSRDVTMSAIDLTNMANLNSAMNDFSLVLAETNQRDVAAARSYSQSFTSVFDKELPDSFIDLGSFIELVMDESGDPNVAAAGQSVLQAISQVVLAEKHGDLKPGATGISIYFPNSELFGYTTDEEFISYTATVDRFAAASLWDDFLAYHYTSNPINSQLADLSVLDPIAGASSQDFSAALEASAPEEDAEVVSPGLGEIVVGEVYTDMDEMGPEDVATISADISGTNIGYVYYYASYYSEEDDSYLMADMGYLNADTMKEVGGSIYPDWGEGDFNIETDWSPTIYYLNDGINEAFIYLEPEVYGETYEEDVYTLYGLYAPGGDESKQQEAMIRFDGNFQMKSFWVFTGSDGMGAPREATFEEGDTFSIWELWQDYNAETEQWEYSYYLGDTLTYSGQPFEVLAYYAFPGTYEVGIIAEDYDGNSNSNFVNITIPEY